MAKSQAPSTCGLKIACLLCVASQAFALDVSEAIRSPYSEALNQVLRDWKPGTDSDASQPQLQVECYEMPGNRLYIGVKQSMTVHAPLASVRAVIEDFARYPQLFDGLVKSEVREREGNRFLVYQEQEIPVPFVSNERMEIFYSVDESKPGQVIFRYQLKKSKHMKFNDGALVLQANGASVRYTEFDFWDADWGFLATTFGAGRIWRDSVRGLVQSDLAIKLRAEHPDWKHEKILEQSKQEAGRLSVDECLDKKKAFPGVVSAPSVVPSAAPSVTASSEPSPRPAPSP